MDSKTKKLIYEIITDIRLSALEKYNKIKELFPNYLDNVNELIRFAWLGHDCTYLTSCILSDNISLSIMQNEINGIINCCTGVPVSLKDKVEEFLKLNNYKIRPEYGVYPEREYDSPAIWGSNKKIMEIKEKYYLEKGEKNDSYK